MALGDVGDDSPPQPENSVASVAPEATLHAPAQNWRRETGVVVSDIAGSSWGRTARPGWLGKIEATRKQRGFY
jgi:hypothetical protein